MSGPSPGFGAGVIQRLCIALMLEFGFVGWLFLQLACREAAATSLRLAIPDIMAVEICV
jgi:hypothetical protein